VAHAELSMALLYIVGLLWITGAMAD